MILINDEERIFAMLLILVLALLFCPSLAEEELRGVKHKYAGTGLASNQVFRLEIGCCFCSVDPKADLTPFAAIHARFLPY